MSDMCPRVCGRPRRGHRNYFGHTRPSPGTWTPRRRVMRFSRALGAVALVLPLMIPSALAWACPPGGGSEGVVFQNERVSARLLAAREAEADAAQEEAEARTLR